MGVKRGMSATDKMFAWVRSQSKKVKISMAVTMAICLLVVLNIVFKDIDYFFIAAEIVHFVGILVLIYKLSKQKTCSGLSLKTQELTAIFLAGRLTCSMFMELDVHTLLDFLTLASTVWVIYMIRFRLKSTYLSDMDDTPLYYLLVPCAVLGVLIHPHASSYEVVVSIGWVFCVYLESVSVLPQLLMVQKAKMIEPFTSHYVFALGVARFLGCGHWILEVYYSGGRYLHLIGAGYFWLPMVLLAQVIQTFILADFCYYYVKSAMNGQLLVRLPLPV